ncbi:MULTISPECIES: endonuclease [unclassified Nocardioides]|uniref:endonuclease n=1 Tax=unclassified Nocardioides TaxID=2615069 RepID=UPI002666D897|nr:endonuclease [Nocardioides sp. Arc9.136]WKN49297.1 endonuclease [Nocardioides sp. Arc9.136]
MAGSHRGHDRDHDTVAALLERHGTTYAEDAGISLDDKPAALWQLLVLSLLLSARISSDIAVAAARELLDAGCTTPDRTRDTPRRTLIAAFGRSGYRRYDERTSTQLGELADKVLDDWSGDLRKLHEKCDDAAAIEQALQEFKGIGPAGAAIFLREVQGVWPDVAPYVDDLAARGADRLGLPTSPDGLADLVPAQDLPRLVAACVRAARDKDVAEDVRDA